MSDSPILSFYKAFQRLDAEAMCAHYSQDIVFEDPAFGILKGVRACNMWRMLCESQKGKNFKLQYHGIELDGNRGSAHWEAQYKFSRTGRPVHNKIHAEFELKEGLIIKHRDHFNLHKWASQALGPSGLILGWTPFFRAKLHKQTNALLDRWEQNHLAGT